MEKIKDKELEKINGGEKIENSKVGWTPGFLTSSDNSIKAKKDRATYMNPWASVKIADENDLEDINGGIRIRTTGVENPVTDMSYEEAMKIAQELHEGVHMGEWRSMSAEEFMNWWRESNNQ